jgi:hypothetical protein
MAAYVLAPGSALVNSASTGTLFLSQATGTGKSVSDHSPAQDFPLSVPHYSWSLPLVSHGLTHLGFCAHLGASATLSTFLSLVVPKADPIQALALPDHRD